MTATPILDTLAKEFSSSTEQVRAVLEMLDAGLGAPYIGRVRRKEAGELVEPLVRRLDRRRKELEELDRRRTTILRMMESAGASAQQTQQIHNCMDRFELEDLFLPHRRPEPEVQLAIDRGLGGLALLLTQPAPKPARGAEAEEPAEHEEAAEASAASGAEAQGSTSAALELPASEVEAAQAEEGAAASESASEGADENEEGHNPEKHEAAAAAATADLPAPKLELTAQLARACASFVQPDRGVHTDEDALQGAMRILSDRLGRDPELRGLLRRMLRKHGVLSVRATVPEARLGRHKPLLKVRQPLPQLQSHRLLAIRQAQKERLVATVITLDRERALTKVRNTLCRRPQPEFLAVLDAVAGQALDRRLLPMIEQDVRLELKERGDEDALRSLSMHLRQVLLAPIFGPRPVMGVDINARGDWTVALVDVHGAPIPGASATIELNRKVETEVEGKTSIEIVPRTALELGEALKTAVGAQRVEGLALGHGKQARLAVQKVREALAAAHMDVFVFLVNEAGLPSWASSEAGRTEFPELSVPLRQAISLARRLQDPLPELLKCDPRHLGLGAEQSLVPKNALRRMLLEALEAAVAYVGVEFQRAPLSMLRYLPGLDLELAKRLIALRESQPITSREELRASGVLSEAQWTSAVAFLRFYNSSDPLDATALHPEQYPLALRIAEACGVSIQELLGQAGNTKGLRRGDFDLDEASWRDLTRELSRPGRDPRFRLFPAQLLPSDTEPKSIAPGTVVEGIVSNVASFGVFVDIGLARDAMVHISEISERYVRDARELLSIGQGVRGRVLDPSGPRVTLSLKNVPLPERAPRPPRRQFEAGGEGGGPGAGRPDRPERSDRGARRGGRERAGSERQPQSPSQIVRGATARRDGLVVGGGGKRGPGGDRRTGGAGRGGSRERGERGERGDERPDPDVLREVRQEKKYNPFASYFKAGPTASEQTTPEKSS